MEPQQLTGVALDRLVAVLEAAHTDARDRIPDAMLIAEHLGQVGDDLIEHVVLTARAQGVSWWDIGSRMGVSKQAAQQRLAKANQAELEPLSPEQGFTRFTVEPATCSSPLTKLHGLDRSSTSLSLGSPPQPESHPPKPTFQQRRRRCRSWSPMTPTRSAR